MRCGVVCRLEVYIYTEYKNEAIYEAALRNSCSRLSKFERGTAKEHFLLVRRLGESSTLAKGESGLRQSQTKKIVIFNQKRTEIIKTLK